MLTKNVKEKEQEQEKQKKNYKEQFKTNACEKNVINSFKIYTKNLK